MLTKKNEDQSGLKLVILDLDQGLIRTCIKHEFFFALSHFSQISKVQKLGLKDKKNSQDELIAQIDVINLPYNVDIIEFIKKERHAGKKIFFAR